LIQVVDSRAMDERSRVVQGLEPDEVPSLVEDAAHGKPKECPACVPRTCGTTWAIDNADDSSPTRQGVFVGNL
jgi:hypothetical protein